MSRTRRSDLDGLRGLAVLLVVGFHAGVPALAGAFIAVDVFFVLSGFFLATAIAQRLATGEEIRPVELAARRAWRLLPVLALVLLGTLASTLLYAPIDRAAVARQMIPVSAFAGNLAFAEDGVNYFGAGENPLLHTWTLGVELQLALGFALLVALFTAWGERRAAGGTASERRLVVLRTVLAGLAIAGIISFALAVILNERAPMWAYFGPHTRLWSFCAGALMAFLTGGGQGIVGGSRTRLTIMQGAGLALLLLPALGYESTLAYPGVVALAPVAGTLLLLAAGEVAATSLPGRALASGPFVSLGRVSYAWYLWHWPLMVLGAILVPGLGIAGRLAWGFAGLVAAILTHRLLRRAEATELVKRLTGSRPALAAVAVCAGLAMVSAGAARSSERFVEQSVHSRYEAARNDHIWHNCWGSSTRPVPMEGCAFGDVGSKTRIALIGDSHASHWLGALEVAGKTRGWRIEPHVMGACPAADLRGLVDGAVERLYRECAGFRERTMRSLAADKPRAVIVSNADFYLRPVAGRLPGIDQAVWTEGLRRTYAELEQLGIEVIAFRALPWVPFDVPSCLSRRAARLPMATACEFVPDGLLMSQGRRAQDEAAAGRDVGFVDMNDHVCGTGHAGCAAERGGVVLYADDNHITGTFSRSLGSVLGERLVLALGNDVGDGAGR